jgi:hypothetical protein
MAGHTPEEGLEQYVAAIISGEQSARVRGRLVGFSELGISLAIPLNVQGQRTEETVFYPWHRVESVRVAREDEQPA